MGIPTSYAYHGEVVGAGGVGEAPMARPTAVEIGEALARLLEQEGGAVVNRWTQLLKAAMPQVFLSMPPAQWSGRVRDVFSVLRRALRQPETLRLPVLPGGPGGARIRALALRSIVARADDELSLYDVQTALFLLEQALLEQATERRFGARRREAIRLIDHFFKQLSVAMTAAVAARQRMVLEEQLRERERQIQGLRQQTDVFFSFMASEMGASAAAILAEHAAARRAIGAMSEEAAGALARADEDARLVQRFAGAMIDHVRLDAGSEPLRVEPFELRRLIEEAVAALEPRWQARRLTIAREVDADLPMVPGDRTRLAEVVLVLLAQAIRLVPEGGTVRVRAYAEEAHVVLDIEDDGFAREAEQRSLFECFERTAEALRDGDAPCLGLPPARLIAELHGGELGVAPGRDGSSLRLKLPRLPRAPRRGP